MNMRKTASVAVVAAFAAGAMALSTPAFAAPGFIALEGSDATTFHNDPVYTPQLFSYLKGSSIKNVLILGDGASNPSPTGVSLSYASSLAGLTLSDYAAIYVKAPGGCCTADPTALNGYGAAVSAFVAAGGNVSIENYIGGSYDGVVPGGAGAIQGLTVSATGCSDGEVVTAAGISKGFGQPPVDFCWSHQSYSNAYFGSFGYLDLIHGAPDYGTFGDGTTSGSSFLAVGGSLGGPGVPEPTTWALMLMGFGGLGLALRQRRTAVAA